MISIELNETSVEDFRAIQELKQYGFSDQKFKSGTTICNSEEEKTMMNEADVLLAHELTKEYSDKIVARFKEITKIFVPELTDEVQVFSSFGKYGEYDPLQVFATISFKFHCKKDSKPYGSWYWIPPEEEFEGYIAIVADHIKLFYEAMKEKNNHE